MMVAPEPSSNVPVEVGKRTRWEYGRKRDLDGPIAHLERAYQDGEA